MILSKNRRHNRKYFYKYTSAKTAKICLTNKVLRLSSPLLLNDPFDIARTIIMPISNEELIKSVSRKLAQLIRNKSHYDISIIPFVRSLLDYSMSLNQEQREYLATNIENGNYKDKNKGNALDELQNVWDKTMPGTRVLSLTETYDNPVMWNSYSDSYKGVVLELECLDIYDSVLLLAEPVIYSDEPIKFGNIDYWIDSTLGLRGFDYNETFKKLELTKKTSWSYEKEWRVLSFENDINQLYTDYVFHPKTFTRVFFGNNISNEDREDIIKLADYDLSHIEFFDLNVNYQLQRFEFKKN